MNEFKQVIFTRPNNVIFSYDLIIVDIYNQLRHHMTDADREIFRVLIESAYNEDQYLFTLKYTNVGDIYFVSDVTKETLYVDDYDQLVISKKHNIITHKAWEWLYNSKYVHLMFRVNISFFNRAAIDIEDGFDMFVLTFDGIYPDSFYMGRFFKNKKKIQEKIIDIRKLAIWFKDILDDNENGILNTVWITDSINDPYNIIEACMDVYGLSEEYVKRIILETNLVCLNEDNMNHAKEYTKQENMIGNTGVINPFKMGLLNSLYNQE